MNHSAMPRFLWINLFFVQVALAGVLYYLEASGQIKPATGDGEHGIETFRNILWILGLGAAVLSLRWESLKFKFFPKLSQQLGKPDLSKEEKIALLFPSYILVLVISEFVSLTGFVLGFLSGTFEAGLPLLAIGLFVSLLKYPKF